MPLFLLAGTWVLLIGYAGLLVGLTSSFALEFIGGDVVLSTLSFTFVFWMLVLSFLLHRTMLRELSLVNSRCLPSQEK